MSLLLRARVSSLLGSARFPRIWGGPDPAGVTRHRGHYRLLVKCCVHSFEVFRKKKMDESDDAQMSCLIYYQLKFNYNSFSRFC